MRRSGTALDEAEFGNAVASLTRRLGSTPERALPHARSWVSLDPADLDARKWILKLALATR